MEDKSKGNFWDIYNAEYSVWNSLNLVILRLLLWVAHEIKNIISYTDIWPYMEKDQT